jgi:thioredoxin-dependent peroxiredoxin
MSTVQIHQVVPNFTASLTGETQFELAAYHGQKIVIFFYPKDNTPGCTLESQEFYRLAAEFSELNTLLFGISRDSLKSHAKFQTSCEFNLPLISDTDEAVCALFGVMKNKTMYGKPVRGIDRSTFVIDEQGVLVQEWRTVKPEGHAEAVLAWIKQS